MAAHNLKEMKRQIGRRRTFAIISHPDAGKTTLTEKLLLYGGAIHVAGSIKLKKGAGRQTTSDWMELEKQRGISVSTSVLQFEFQGRHINLLDTPGHNDFSEDTYRTLSAADGAVMLIDSVKGIEPQTIKLFQVCRMRNIPIVTFINKLDRDGRDPIDLLDEIENVLGIPCTPATWPIGSGARFKGVYDRWNRRLLRFDKGEGGSHPAPMEVGDMSDPVFKEEIGAHNHGQLVEELALLDALGPFDQELFMGGGLTPVFFGSAINNFGVEPFLDAFVDLAPEPQPRPTVDGEPQSPYEPWFSAFVFKIQANMDPRHRDRIVFARVCSGKFERGMEVVNCRTDRSITLAKSVQFLAQERVQVDQAYAGDIIGLWDPGNLRIGDSLTTGPPVEFEGIPRFSPEHFLRIRLSDPMKRKQLKKGLEQLSEEGAVQLFHDRFRLESPVLGAVGVLQFEVTQYRLTNEYGVTVQFEPLPYNIARWIEGDVDLDRFEKPGRSTCVIDVEGRPLVLFNNDWSLRMAVEANPELRFIAAVQPGRLVKSVA